MAKKRRIIRSSMNIIDLLIASGVTASKEQARQMIKGGEVHYNGVRVSSDLAQVAIGPISTLEIKDFKRFEVRPLTIIEL
jgi:RNA-binding protein YlmH